MAAELSKPNFTVNCESDSRIQGVPTKRATRKEIEEYRPRDYYSEGQYSKLEKVVNIDVHAVSQDRQVVQVHPLAFDDTEQMALHAVCQSL